MKEKKKLKKQIVILLLIILYFILLLAVLSSCNPCKYVSRCNIDLNKDTIIKESIVVVKDSVEILKIDSNYIEALLECDSNKNVILKELLIKNNERTKIETLLKNNRFYVRQYQDSIKILHKIVEKLKKEKEVKTIYVKDNTEVKLLKEQLKKEKLKYNLQISFVLLILLIYYIIIRFKIFKIIKL